jgi:hypothetical protein
MVSIGLIERQDFSLKIQDIITLSTFGKRFVIEV